MTINNIFARWHNYFYIEATADDPGYVMPIRREYHDKKMSDAIKHLNELIRDGKHEWNVWISWVY